MLSDLSVISSPPNLKSIPDFEVKIKVDKTFMSKFIAGKGALADTDNFTVITDDEGVKVVIGYAEINTNRVTLPVETESYDTIENVSFNANLFRDVLVANKECESATLEVSSGGLARINFKIDEYDATYYSGCRYRCVMETTYVDKSRVTVRPIYKPLAKDMIEKNHYSGRLSSCRYPLGVFYKTDNPHQFFDETEEKLIGVACYGFPVGRRVVGSIFKEEIIENKNVLELTRLFIHDGVW